MKYALVIGSGRFGRHLARRLTELGNEVMAVDRDEEALQDILPIVTRAEIGDCTKEYMLRSIGVENFDMCFVCIASDFQSSLEITAQLKEMGARYVVSKAASDIQAKFLLRSGADEVAYPERDVAEKLAVLHSRSNIEDYFEITPDVSIYEITVTEDWVGKSIRELDFRARYGASILAIKNGDDADPAPSPDHIFAEGESMVIVGRDREMQKLLKRL